MRGKGCGEGVEGRGVRGKGCGGNCGERDVGRGTLGED